MHVIAAKAVAFGALKPEFREYAENIVKMPRLLPKA